MPHQCVSCGEPFADGAEEILNGCRECGGNKFQFVPESALDGDSEADSHDSTDASPDSTPSAPGDSVEDSETESSGPIQAEPAGHEDSAQHAARTDVVDPDSIPSTALQSNDSVFAGSDEDAPEPEQESEQETGASIEEVRRELNEQFESIKIVSPGEYELNLMELYNQDDYIISLFDDGKYAIHMRDQDE